jgi:hypothetical protein
MLTEVVTNGLSASIQSDEKRRGVSYDDLLRLARQAGANVWNNSLAHQITLLGSRNV